MASGADTVLQRLLGGGVDVCFANPGTSEMHFVAALDSEPRMRAVLTLFGFVHSVDPRGGIYVPWALEGLPRLIAWQFAAAYAALAALLALLSLQRRPAAEG